MTTKERILALLEENRGTPLSGEVLAEELGGNGALLPLSLIHI